MAMNDKSKTNMNKLVQLTKKNSNVYQSNKPKPHKI